MTVTPGDRLGVLEMLRIGGEIRKHDDVLKEEYLWKHQRTSGIS
jgi:hypothetical protein